MKAAPVQPSSKSAESSDEASFFEDFIACAQRIDEVLGDRETTTCPARCIPTLVLLRLVGAEWLTVSQYLKSRLSAIDWEVAHPKEFLAQAHIDTVLRKLHNWRRWVPVFREMLLEAKPRLSQLEDLDCPPGSFGFGRVEKLFEPYAEEFAYMLDRIEDYEKRIDRLTTVVASAISTADSRRVEQLTLLATLFVPLSLIGTLFSMSEDIAQIRVTFAYWAAASLILLLVMVACARLISSQAIQKIKGA